MSKNFTDSCKQDNQTKLEFVYSSKLSLEKCKKILNRSGFNFNTEKVREIREFLCQLGRLELKIYNNIKNEECNNLYPCIN
jgi:hypothetical protein